MEPETVVYNGYEQVEVLETAPLSYITEKLSDGLMALHRAYGHATDLVAEGAKEGARNPELAA